MKHVWARLPLEISGTPLHDEKGRKTVRLIKCYVTSWLFIQREKMKLAEVWTVKKQMYSFDHLIGACLQMFLYFIFLRFQAVSAGKNVLYLFFK